MSDAAAVPSREGFPLSPQQRRLWELRARSGGRGPGAILVLRAAAEGDGDDPAPLLVDALEAAVRHHEILRTRLVVHPGLGVPLQVVMPRPGVEWRPEEDWSGLAPAAVDGRLAERVEEALGQPPDPTSERPLRASVVHLGDGRALLSVETPALLADPEGLRRLGEEIGRRAAGLPLSLDELQYADLAQWQNDLLSGEDGEEGRSYWQGVLRPLTTPLRLPGERQAARRSADAALAGILVSDPAPVRRAAADLGVSLEDLLLTCWLALLGRLAADGEPAVAVAFDGRRYRELERAQGPFERHLPVAVDTVGRPFCDLLGDVRRRLETAAEWQECWDGPPGEELSFGFAWEPRPPRWSFGPLSVAVREVDVARGDFVAHLAAGLREGGLRLRLRHDPRRLPAGAARRLLARFETLLRSACAHPERAMDELELLPEAERRELVALGSGPALGTPALLPERIGARAAADPDRVAVICGTATLSYGALWRRAGGLALRLRATGAGPESRVALCLQRSEGVIVAILACWRAGAAYVPLDAANPPVRLAALLEDCGAAAVITDAASVDRLPASPPRVILPAGQEGVADDPGATLPEQLHPANLAYVIYTSGSTGRPKGVAVEHRQIAAYVAAAEAALELPPGGCCALVSTFAADLGSTVLFPSLAGGGSLVIVPEDRLADPASMAEEMERHGADCMKIVPSHLALLLRARRPERVLPRRCLILGGESVTWELVDRVVRLAPGLRVFNHYGPTETTVGVLAGPLAGPEGAGPGSGDGGRRPASPPLGRPLPGSRVFVLDGALRPVPAGEVGQLWLGGRGVSRGYLGAPARTAARFVPDPHSGQPGARLYRSSDLGSLAGERVVFRGRSDHQVKVRGFRVEPGEIEAALERHGRVDRAVVVARGGGDGNVRLVAYAVPSPGAEVTVGELRGWLEERLPAALIPHRFVPLQELPLTANGKVDRDRLPDPDAVAAGGSARHHDATEVQVAHLWEEILGVESVGRNDNFFQLGGDSFLAVRLMAKVRRHFGVELPLASLITAADAGELADRIRRQTAASDAEHLVPLQPRGSRPPLYCVHPGHGNVACYLELAHRLGREQPLYGFQALDFDQGRPPVCIGEMARRYAEAAVENQPPGQPFRVAGWSFGGLIAFEMAHRLRALGREVDRVILFDTRLPLTAPALVAVEPTRLRASLLFAHLRPPPGEAPRVTVDELVPLDLNQQLELAAERMERPVEQLVPEEIGVDLLRRYLDVRMARIRALAEYEWRPYPGTVTLLRAGEPAAPPALEELEGAFARAAASEDYGWSRWADRVDVRTAAGSHDSMLAEPHVRELAERMTPELIVSGAAPDPLAAAPAVGRWSPLNEGMLATARERPELADRTTFGDLVKDNPLPSMALQPWPFFLSASADREAGRIAVGLDRLLRSVFDRFFDRDPGRVADFYRSGDGEGDFFRLDLSEDEAALLLEEPSGIRGAPSRGDYVDTGEGLKLIEYNAGSGLGGWQVERAEELVRRHPEVASFLDGHGARVGHPPVVTRLFRHFARHAVERGVWRSGELNLALVVRPHEPEQVAIHSRSFYQREFERALGELRPGLEGRVFLCGFDDLREEGGRLTCDGAPVHVLFEQHDGGGDAGVALRYAKLGAADLFTGPVTALLSDKRNLALLSEHADSPELDRRERDLVARHLPWTRRLTEQRTRYRGAPLRLPEDIEEHRETLVLKKATSLAGGHVILGPHTAPRRWRKAVARAVAEGDWVVQEYLRPAPYVFLEPAGAPALHDLIWGLFVFGGEYAGPFLRAQARRPDAAAPGVVNTGQGAEVVLPLVEREGEGS